MHTVVNQRDIRATLVHTKLTEEIPDAASSHAHKHLVKLWTRCIIEWDISLSGNCPCQERFASARGSHEQNSCGIQMGKCHSNVSDLQTKFLKKPFDTVTNDLVVFLPLGSFPPRTVNFCGFLRNSTTSWSSFFASSTPFTCSKVTFFIWIGSTAESRPEVVRNLTVGSDKNRDNMQIPLTNGLVTKLTSMSRTKQKVL